MDKLNRREFITGALAASVAAGVVRSAAAAVSGSKESEAGKRSIRLGGPCYVETDDPDKLAQSHRDLGYRAAYCPDVSLDDPGRIRAFAEAFARHDVVIAEVGVWVNLMDADPDKQRANLQQVTEGLALADEIGARCCVDIAGSFNKEYWFGPHPENLSERFFDAAVENARKIIDAVKPKRAKFCYEMLGWAIPDSPDSNLRLLKAMDRDGFAVHLDPCNLINSPKRFYDNTAVINECFDKLGPWIVSCHAKDLTWVVEMNVHFREVQPGTGSIDYKTFLKRLAALPQDAPLMLEHLEKAEEYAAAARYIVQQGSEIGVGFE